MGRIAFIDVEASSLSQQGWPLEIGWGYSLEPASTRSLLVRPEPEWTDWDVRSWRVHRIDYRLCVSEGLSAEDVVGILEEAIRGAEVHSDHPPSDARWLDRLYEAAGRRRGWVLNPTDSLWPGRLLSEVSAAQAWADEVSPKRHRAGPDVRNLIATHMRLVGAAWCP